MTADLVGGQRQALVDGQRQALALLERSMLSSWPALATAFDGDWVIRLADGVTNRSNSVTCLEGDASDLDRRIDRVEAVFERHGQPPTFRISPLASPALTDALDKRGWKRFDESIVMMADAASVDQKGTEIDHEIEITTDPDAAWFEGCCRIEGLSRDKAATLSLMLARLIPTAGFGRLVADDRIAALALAVIDNDLVGLFEVMTARDQRRKGYSRALLSALLGYGRDHGATTGWLAVAARNQPAIRLYRSLGFSEVYRYHYRSRG